MQPSDPGNLSLAARNLLRLKRASSLLCLYEDFIIFPLDFLGEDVLRLKGFFWPFPVDAWCYPGFPTWAADICTTQQSCELDKKDANSRFSVFLFFQASNLKATSPLSTIVPGWLPICVKTLEKDAVSS